MSKDFIVQQVVKNWYLVAIAFWLVVAGVTMALRDETIQASASEPEMNANAQASVEDVPTSRWAQTTRADRAHEAIEEYKAKIVEDPRSEEAAMNTRRIASVYYSTLHDYEQASTYYENLLQDYPDFNMNRADIYANLAKCYERLGNLSMERHTYQRMLREFPAGSQEYLFAKEKLRVR